MGKYKRIEEKYRISPSYCHIGLIA